MINPFLLNPRDRLSDWKRMRSSLHDMTEADQLSEVAKYWALAPLNRIAYDAEDISSWPSVWEMIDAGEWCRASVAVGMEATLRLVGWNPNRLTIRHIDDRIISDIFLIVEIDGALALNYDHGGVIETPKNNFHEMARWRFIGRNYTRVSV